MASVVIHMSVASEINKVLKRNNDKLLIGSIAPDIAKLLGESKVRSHFLDDEHNDIPNMEKFLNRYKDSLSDDFVLGYYIHLYTDYLWFKYFVTEFYNKDIITKLDGTLVKCNGNMIDMYLYNDYTNLNKVLLHDYCVDVSALYGGRPLLSNIIKEIPMFKIDLIIDKTVSIIDETKVHKDLTFNILDVKKFISTSVELIIANLNELGVE